MKRQKLLVTLCALSLVVSAQVNAASAKKDPANDVETALSQVPVAELPATAVQLVTAAKRNDKEDVALAAIRYTATAHPGSIVPLVSSLAKILPDDAADIASTAAALVPAEAAAIATAAMKAAPESADKINRALSGNSSNAANPVGPPTTAQDNGNRPDIPPGLGDGTTKMGSIRGNRPDTPPGHIRNPMPGRDPKRNTYASP